ncbi:hypothetical protein GCM10022270_08830 [Terriglobus aquaticus]
MRVRTCFPTQSRTVPSGERESPVETVHPLGLRRTGPAEDTQGSHGAAPDLEIATGSQPAVLLSLATTFHISGNNDDDYETYLSEEFLILETILAKAGSRGLPMATLRSPPESGSPLHAYRFPHPWDRLP